MKAFVMVPTYNESKNIRELIEELLKYPVEIVVVDDNSPDGTSDIVSGISNGNKRVHILTRKGDRGRGRAGKAGYAYCIEKGADYILEMDADFSHDPSYVPSILDSMKDADVVLGSRMVEGGKEVGRGFFRKLITSGANFYIRVLLGLKVKDCNSGFRCFRREVLEQIGVEKIFSNGPDIVQEVLFRAHLRGFRIKEVPIVFRERTRGKSKLGLRHLWKGYVMVMRLKYLSMKGDI